MHFLPVSIFSTLLFALFSSCHPVEPTPPPCGSCLTSSEILPVATRWLDVFSTGGRYDLPNAATEDVQYWNEEFTYPGCPTPFAANRSQLWDIIGETAHSWTTCTNISFEVVSAWSSCDRIAVRWREHAVVSSGVNGSA